MNAPTIPARTCTPSAKQGRTPHESARLHVTGEAVYTDDIPELRGTLYAALVLSPGGPWRTARRGHRPRGHPARARRGGGVHRARHSRREQLRPHHPRRPLPGRWQGGVPGPAGGRGGGARDAVCPRGRARPRCWCKELPAILTIEEAMAPAASSCRPRASITRAMPREAIAAAPHRVKGAPALRPAGTVLPGRPDHLCRAARRRPAHAVLSTQHPDGNQREAAAALNLSTHDVEVICRRMGGGFGGKEGNASIFSQSAALAAFKLQKPVKLRVNRDDDMMITGKRHDFRIDYEVGFDDDGRILGAGRHAGLALRLQRRLLRPGERPRLPAHRQLLPPAQRSSWSATAARRTRRAPPRSAASAARRACSASRR
jgi:xanthine dehydrogenase large subunit